MKNVKNLTLLLCLSALLFNTNLFAQESQENKSAISFDFGADVMSRYVWRGALLGGSSPSIQPGVSMGIKGLEFGAWGAYSLGGKNTSQEFDLYLSYTFLNDMLTLTATDYFLPTEFAAQKYFEWNKDKTGHVLEGTVAFNGTENLPISFLFAMNFYGADAMKLKSDGVTTDGIQYSNYFELGYSFGLNSVDCNAFIGGTLNNPDTKLGEGGFYGNGAGIVNLGLTAAKEVKITDNFALPLSASIITNPQAEKIFFVFGFSF
jgi:hypothetical protein